MQKYFTRVLPTALLLVFLGVAPSHPALAQITFGSPGDPPRIVLGGGAFNVLVDTKKAHSATTGTALAEFRFGDAWWIVAPFVGVFGTGQGAFYGYFGIGFDIHLPADLIFTPSVAFGYFDPGQGINLGSIWEFRDGAELVHRFADERRLGIGFYHMSNAGIGKQNPGQEMLTAVFTAPFR